MITEVLAASASRTANGQGSAIGVPLLRGLVSFFLNVSAQSGTTPTLDVVIEAKDPLSGLWDTVVAFTQVGAATGIERVTAEVPDAEIRARWTLTGGSADYTFSVSANGKP
jgi:hypothetical protein